MAARLETERMFEGADPLERMFEGADPLLVAVGALQREHARLVEEILQLQAAVEIWRAISRREKSEALGLAVD